MIGVTVLMVKQVIVVRKDLNMRKGKIASQVAHAAMMFLLKPAQIHWATATEAVLTTVLDQNQHAWVTGDFTKITAAVKSEAELRELIEKAKAAGVTAYECVDNGYTEFHGVPTLTCAAFGPDYAEKVDAITGGLPLL